MRYFSIRKKNAAVHFLQFVLPGGSLRVAALLLLAACAGLDSLAQRGRYEPGGYLGISAGASFPSEDLAMDNLFEGTAGLARTGFQLHFVFSYKIRDHFGIAAALTGSFLPLDDEAIRSGAEMIHQWQCSRIEAVSGTWMTGGLSAGPYAIFEIARKLYFDARILVGLVYHHCDPVVVTRDGTEETLRDELSGISAGYALAPGLKYMLNTRLYLMGDIIYSVSTPTFDNVTVPSISNKTEVRSIQPDLGQIATTMGIGFFLE
ncbi:MAG: hypothetical protein JW861_03900 [Bacteroidales bacterium]|nr:hypothetical protein [Bacteroidales bacterium]